MSIMCIALILMLHVTFMLWVHQPLLSLSQAMPMYHHLSLPSSFMFLQVTLFPPPLMFIHFLVTLLNALHLYVKFYLIWSWFGWVQKWSKFEFNSNMIYFSASKNAQLNFIKFHITPGSWRYFHISHATLLSLCILFSLFSVWRKKEREECIQERGFTWTPAF